ncbi:MAG: hypothetical protein ACLRPS_04275 [Paraprevotella clara]|uniref:Regulator of chromosome condensation (RCC1) repeat protein n=1 Tax=Paraprevotella clara TaxID=454154 RepID=A0A6N3F5U7_9BACT
MKKFTKMCAVAACALFAGTATVSAEDYVWKSVTAGDATTYGIRSDGSLWSWGWNEKGQSGNGVSERTATPTLADGNRVWKKTVGGKAYGFFLAEDGSLWAAGTATNGVQGTNDGVDHKVLTRIGTDNDWVDMACSRFWGYSAFAIKTNGTLWSWGENSAGQLGIGNTQAQTLPVQVGTDTDWKQVAAGVSSVLALKTDGSLWGWGLNMNGELFGYEGRQSSPVRLGSETDWEKVLVIEFRAYAVKKDGTLWAWGDNSRNLLGFNTPTEEESTSEGNPVEVVTEPRITKPTQVTAVEGEVLAVSGCENTLSVATGADGIIEKVWMFGSNADGALGDGKGLGNGNKDIPFATVPVNPSLKSSLKFTSMSSGQNYTMMLTDDGDIWGWGCNRGGQLGDETPNDQLQVAYKLKPIVINCPQDEVSSVGSLKDGKVDAAVSFDGQVLALQSDGLLTSGRIYDMNGAAVMILAASETSWNVATLSQGVYVAEFMIDGAPVTYKFAVK